MSVTSRDERTNGRSAACFRWLHSGRQPCLVSEFKQVIERTLIIASRTAPSALVSGRTSTHVAQPWAG